MTLRVILSPQEELLEQALRDDARHLDEIIAIGEALGAPDGSTGPEILEVARGLTHRVKAMEFLLRHNLPKCGGCNALATRTYVRTAGRRGYACDDNECITEHFCARCGRVTYETGGPCALCGGAEYTPRVEAWRLTELPFADVRRRAGVTRDDAPQDPPIPQRPPSR